MAVYILWLLTAFYLAIFRVDAKENQSFIIAQLSVFHEGEDIACNSTRDEVVLRTNSPGCKCISRTSSRCCATFSTKRNTTEYCTVMNTSNSKEEFQVLSTIDEKKLFSKPVNFSAPYPLCAGLGVFGEVCLQFPVAIKEPHLKICLQMQSNILILEHIVFLGCFEESLCSEENFHCLPK